MRLVCVFSLVSLASLQFPVHAADGEDEVLEEETAKAKGQRVAADKEKAMADKKQFEEKYGEGFTKLAQQFHQMGGMELFKQMAANRKLTRMERSEKDKKRF